MLKYFAIIFIIFSILFPTTITAAQKYKIVWEKTLNNGSNDQAYGIALDSAGNIYVTGSSDIIRGTDTTCNYLTVKYNNNGNILWADTINNGIEDEAYDIAVDNNDNIYVTGESYILATSDDYLTIKYDPQGNIIWADSVDNGYSDDARGITIDKGGNIYVTGFLYNGSNADYFTVKYNSSGNILWADTLDSGGDDFARGIAVDSSGNIYVTGSFPYSSNADYFTVKYNSSGNILWADTLDNGNGDYANDITIDKGGNIYVTGQSYIGTTIDCFTVEYDPLGNIIWADTIDNGNTNLGHGITTDKNNNIYVAGQSYIGSDYDYLIVKYDNQGHLVWEGTLDKGDIDYAEDIAVDNNGNIYVTGVSSNGSNDDYLTVKYRIYKDTEISSLVSPDTICVNSTYAPKTIVKNNSNNDTLTFNIIAYIDNGMKTHIYDDTLSITNLLPGDSTIATFKDWYVPSNTMDITLGVFTTSMDTTIATDSTSYTLYIRDIAPPIIDTTLAFDGTNAVSGIDDDDYVIIYFSEPTNKVVLDNTNIDSVLFLSNGHSWLDGMGHIGTCVWNTNGDQLQINLTTNTSLPTIAVGDTITPDGITITDSLGNPCSSVVTLGGSFEPTGISDKKNKGKMQLNAPVINKRSIPFFYRIANNTHYTIILYSIDGRVIRKIEGERKGYHTEKISHLPSGIYFLRLEQGKNIMNKKVVVIK